MGSSNLEGLWWRIFLYNQQLVDKGRVETYSYDVIYYDFLPNFFNYIGVFSGGFL